MYKNNRVSVDWKIIKKVKKKLNIRFKELRDLIENKTGCNYKITSLTNWVGYRKQRENLKIKLPILMLFSKILNKKEIVPLEYSWIEETYKSKKFCELKNKYEINNNTFK